MSEKRPGQRTPPMDASLSVRWKTVGGMVLLSVWGSALLVIVGALMVGHWVPLPKPAVGERWRVARAVDRGNTGHRVFHFLYDDCPCSRRVLRKVLSRAAITGISEKIVLITNSSNREVEEQARRQGFFVAQVSPSQLKAEYNVESAPLLLVINADNQIVYSGGYSDRKQAYAVNDEEIITSVAERGEFEGYPVLGCAVSKELKRLVDPFRFKYRE